MAGNKKASKHTQAIGLRIRDARIKKFGKSLIFAKAMGITPATASIWESGRVSFTADMLFKISEMLGVNPGWLLTGKGEMLAGNEKASPTEPGEAFSPDAEQATSPSSEFLSSLENFQSALLSSDNAAEKELVDAIIGTIDTLLEQSEKLEEHRRSRHRTA